MLDRPSPYVVGKIPSDMIGFLLHSSRSGLDRDELSEFHSTSNYCQSNPYDYSWHATIGPGIISIHMRPDQWGWNAKTASWKYIAVEFSQGIEGGLISDSQVDAYCWYLKNRVLPVWPKIPLSFICHSELDDQKTDAYPKGEQSDDFKQRIVNRLTEVGYV